MRPGARLALVDTLRAAAPWQAVRRAEAKGAAQPGRIDVRREDFRFKKFVQRRETTIVFCVDASGSTAFHRLAETKGAVELLLGQAYAARTHVALVVFRGTGADLLLPPTRSLSRAKALLATLPGGGGTPLAAGIDIAIVTAMAERARQREPLIVLLTDGRANVGRDGLPARPQAGVEALTAATQIARQRIGAVFIDTSPRPRPDAADLAAAMRARYVALPYVEASAVRDAVIAATPIPNARRVR
jgi:magnesium chelatase subunit D